jgi:Domain of unknown function (DUF4349)
MSEARFDMVLQELRDSAPRAPEGLRDRVSALPALQQRRSLRLRPALAVAIALAISVALGAAVIGGFTGSSPKESGSASGEITFSGPARGRAVVPALPEESFRPAGDLAPSLTAKSRLQQQQVSMRLRVDDLSSATQNAVRQTRRLGGYVAAANYSTGETSGDSRLDLRVPAQNVQKAIASFTELGTILAQRISVADLQAGLDRLDSRIARARRAGDEQALRRLERSRDALVREGTYAKVSLQLTTQKAAEQQEAPGRFDRFWGDAGDILGKEAIAMLYALVIVGPFAILVALALLAERTRRRRADHRLLEETG